jgi:UDP-3-O-[3-hydroxymyristoyl] glucosamine N-acyltransferase
MAISAEQIIETFQPLVTLAMGNPKQTADKPCAQENPVANAITYVSDKKTFLILLQSPVNIIVADAKLLADENLAQTSSASSKTILQSKNVYLAMAKINQRYFALPFLREPFHKDKIHPTAVIHPDAKIDSTVIIGPGVVVSANVKIGARTFIGANSVIETNVQIGENCFIQPQVTIGHTVRIGNNVEIKAHSVVGTDGFGFAHDEKGNKTRVPHYGELIIEDNVHIGASVNIDRGTYEPSIIGFGTIIDNHCHLGHNIQVGKNSIMTAGFISAGSAKIGSNVVFGGRSSVNGKVEICDNVTIGGLSGVTNDIKKPGMYGGYPTIEYKSFLKAHASFGSLPRLRRNLSKVMKHLGLKDESES